MKKSVYHIQTEFLQIAELLADGELTPELEMQLQINETELQTKAVNYSFIIKQFEDRAGNIDAEIKRLTALKKSATSNADRLKTNITNAMNLFGVEKIEHELMTISFRKSKQCVINDDVSAERILSEWIDHPLLPFIKTVKTYSFDKTELKNAIESGMKFDGVQMVENKSLQIK